MTLTERVARAICDEDESFTNNGNRWDWQTWTGEAEAAIQIVLEEAAKVVDLKDGPASIAAAIRALAEDKA